MQYVPELNNWLLYLLVTFRNRFTGGIEALLYNKVHAVLEC